MRKIVRAGLSAAAVTAAGIVALAPSAAAAPSYYDPEIWSCSHLFRTPLEAPRPGAAAYWSPFGTSNIVCYDDGSGLARYYQRDPGGAWHDMNELVRGNFFPVIFSTTIPDHAHWRAG